MDDSADLFFGFQGRIGRGGYWAGWAFVSVISLALGVLSVVIADVAAIPISERGEFPMSLVVFVMKTIVLYPLAAVTVKRLHDCDMPGYHAAFAIAPIWLDDVAEFAGITGKPAQATDFEIGFTIFSLLMFFGYTLALGLLRGTAGANRYGPNPLAPDDDEGAAIPS